MRETVEFLELLITAEALAIVAIVLPLIAAAAIYTVFDMYRERARVEE